MKVRKNYGHFSACLSLVVFTYVGGVGNALAEESVGSGHGLSPIEKYVPSMDTMYLEKLSMPEPLPGAPEMTEGEFTVGSFLYFERCAGCHGALRQGSTGGAITPDVTHKLGINRIQRTIYFGTGGGMPNWGEADVLSEREVDILAKFIMHAPPTPKEFSFEDIKNSWKLLVPISERPINKANDLDTDNLFAVTLRDVGKVALIDGTSKKIIQLIDTGYAVHVSRTSASGRYLYIISRDGNLAMVDLWMKQPTVVAKVRVGYESRSVQGSKMSGWEDRYVVAGSYWPPQFTILDGKTLRPIKIVSTRGMTSDTMEYHHEPRVASIGSSRHHPEFIINIKETGKILLVNYSDIENLTVTTIDAELFLHDGGFDTSKRYYLVAANAKNAVAVVDTKKRKLIKIVRENIGDKPHPGHGANFHHPVYGPVWATSHLGDNTIALIGADPEKYPQNSWRVVQKLHHSGGGSLFARTHPNSQNLWVDAPLNQEPAVAGAVSVFNINDLESGPQTLDLAAQAGITDGFPRIVQGTYNRDGDEVWFSVWNAKNNKSAIVVVDDASREVKHVIKDNRIVTPTGKFNVHISRTDSY